MKCFCVLLLLLCSTWAHESNKIVNVLDFGAVADGETDDTLAFRKAIKHAHDLGGTTMFVPSGWYMIEGTLFVDDNVVMAGPVDAGPPTACHGGAILKTTHGHDNESADPFITLGCNSALKGIRIVYPKQMHPTEIKPYPWTIRSLGDNPTLVNVLVQNPYKMVDFGTVTGGRHYIRGLYGQPLKVGLYIDHCLDVGRVEDVHFWPFWTPAAQHFTQLHGTAFIIGRSDWQYFFNTFALGYRYGYRFIQGRKGGMANGNFLGIGSDVSSVAVQIDYTQGMGLQITNGEFTGFSQTFADPVVVNISDSNSGSIRFTNTNFWGKPGNVAQVRGTGTVSFDGCTFSTWDGLHQGDAAILAKGPGSVLVRGCDFQQFTAHDGAPQLETHASAIFKDNVINGRMRVRSRGGHAVISGDNLTTSGLKGRFFSLKSVLTVVGLSVWSAVVAAGVAAYMSRVHKRKADYSSL